MRSRRPNSAWSASPRLLEELGNPHLSYRTVHVAGTNGKGSVCAMLERVLRTRYRTGLTISPHLVEPLERIQVDGLPCTPAEFHAAFERVKAASLELLEAGHIDGHPSYFEMVTAMAFWHFAQCQVDIAVLETGLGGRLDATNVCHPDLTVITRIDLDHQAWLGDTIEAIAAEKAGILKPGVPAVFAPQRPQAERVLRFTAQSQASKILPLSPVEVVQPSAQGSLLQFGPTLKVWCPLAGDHQVENARAAVTALRALGISDDEIASSLPQTVWPGRLEQLHTQPDLLLDGAHNPNGAEALAAHLERWYAGRPKWLIYGAMRDKEVSAMIARLFPLFTRIVLTEPANPRALPVSELATMAAGSAIVSAPSVPDAIAIARQAPPEAVVVIAGSLYLIGEARPLLLAGALR